ncbi:MAG TPA: FimV/HubP family polar landmark protein [Ideonella sp.]|uniref:FimV/HubP family polar landmark protein n=1 Tax=Ideonella sp. TaxID=1929293 RepID=UPI002BA43865|nr:FimV/HubP family polar landmark protein [Ideonella sp.]HSI50460.1 FimV/HubP family polar landmark protein [Ideonella sp.]
MTVQSALGESLRAEIEITGLTADEAASLRSSVASGDAFRAAGVDYNAVLIGAQATLQRRSDGRPIIRLVGERAVSEPFVDVILDFSWNGGRLQRSYTLLIDPPTTRSSAGTQSAPVNAAPAISAAPIAPTPAPAQVAPPPIATAPYTPPRPAPAQAPATAPRSVASQPATPSSASGDSVKVRSGDTLSSIANANARQGVSLDQMLVGLYRGNPQAFLGNNMNRLKAGVVLNVPDAQSAGSIGADEAHQVIQAHSADFSAFRQRLAEGAPAVKTTESARQASGKVEAAVQDRKPGGPATAPDQLKLSRGKAGETEGKISKESERKAADTRVAELSRNVEELKKLSGGKQAAAAPAAASAPQLGVKVPVAAAPAPGPAVPPAPAPAAPAPAVVVAPPPVVASAPAQAASMATPTSSAAASAPVLPASDAASVPKPRPRPLPAPVPVAEPSFLESLTGNPFVLPGAVGLVALLAGLGVMRLRRRSSDQGSETSFVESKLQPDSFFGASGGQRVDTRDGTSSSSSSLSYSLSQLDAIGDVDPVAEADVYLAYGRDLQAEEILKEALRTDPGRVAIRSKMLEVYAKRADAKSFEIQARQLVEMTGGLGEEWEKAQELGRSIDPNNALYQPTGPIDEVDIDTSSDAPPDLREDPATAPYQPPAAPAPVYAAPEPLPAFDELPLHADARTPEGRVSTYDLDIDLDAASSLTGLESTRPLTTVGGNVTELPPLQDELGGKLDALDMPEVLPTGMEPLPDLSDLQPPAPPAAPAPDSGSVEFDFGDLSLDLNEPTTAAGTSADLSGDLETESGDTTPSMSFDLEPEDGDPLQRKIELADEFRRIGDIEGARDLLEEVLSKGSAALRARAQAMLDELG